MMTKPLNVELSTELAQTVKSQAKTCFDNAHRAALVTKGAKYVQGFLVYAGSPYKPIEYSWLELEDCLVDPTFPHLHKDADRLFYFPAQRLTVKQLKAAIDEAQEDYPDDEALPVYGDAPYEFYGDRMLGGKEYALAFSEAEAKCKELNKPSNKSKATNSDTADALESLPDSSPN
ncbi:hypothetical protein V2H45_02265 [Tumidithrix elongata RA019]|uniref:Uncharacterized protein n=2 Tax=Tumidithrix TaxID=3088355 RepID=A0AAW9PQB2_9CYAN|nr:hypothetical protein [Tumidithrix elongata RA019]